MCASRRQTRSKLGWEHINLTGDYVGAKTSMLNMINSDLCDHSRCSAYDFFRNADYNKMRSTSARCTLDGASRGSYSAFPETVHLSGERPTGEERVPYITYPCAFDSPQMCELNSLQAGVDIVATTLWPGHQSMQTAHGRT